MGSTMPFGKQGAEPTITAVLGVIAASVAATSARPSGPTGMLTLAMRK